MPKITPIIGHESQCKQLLGDIESDNIAHAYLFSGVRHLGKMSVARWFALQLLLKDNPSEEHEKIKSEVERLVHSDLLVLDQLWMDGVCDDWDIIAKTSNVPQQHRAKKPPAKTDIISIDDVRAMQERLYETGTGTHRCCVIRSMERMQDAAANAFLKILEEPPEGVVFIITTQTHSMLLPTVISRMRTIQFHRLGYAELQPLLEDVSEDDAQFILHLSQGAPGTVITLKSDSDLLRERRLLHSKAASFWKSKSLREKLDLLTPLHKRGIESRRLLTHLSLALREQGGTATPAQVAALTNLSRDLETNAHRQLLTQKFVLNTTE
ncbi:hypothetical protein KJ652_00495 [Patescibacteria group bacterium]|nr:hypothetical protein [Patescibacteria group bacterium]